MWTSSARTAKNVLRYDQDRQEYRCRCGVISREAPAAGY